MIAVRGQTLGKMVLKVKVVPRHYDVSVASTVSLEDGIEMLSTAEGPDESVRGICRALQCRLTSKIVC